MTILIIILIPLLLFLIAQGYVYVISFFSPYHKRPAFDEPLVGEQYEAVAEDIYRISHIMQRYAFEEVMIHAQDGTLLYGRYYHLKDGAPITILFHGYRSHPYRDCSGGHALARKMGFNTLVVDQRAHGRSSGRTITFGIKERFDCLCWINYLNHRFGTQIPIILSGLSMGAATVLMAADLNLPDNVCCILADSPYSAPTAIIEKVCADKNYPVPFCRPFLHMGALLSGRFRLNSASAIQAVRKAQIPILLIHGEDDRFVPCQMSLEIAANCASRVELATFPDAGHGLCYMSDPLRYELVVTHFLQTIPRIKNHINPTYIENLHRNMAP